MATVTTKFKKQLLESIASDMLADSNEYYIAIAKSDPWNETDTVPTEVNSESEVREFRNNMLAIKKLVDFSFVTHRNNWDSGETYRSITDAVDLDTITNYVVKTDNNSVYVCVEQGRDDVGLPVASQVNPQLVGTGTKSKRTSDGYVWKYAYTISGVNGEKYLSNEYIPVDKITTPDNINETLQKTVQDSAVSGSIIGYRVVNAGTGYAQNTTVLISGPGTGAEAVVSVDSDTGSIIKIEVADSSDNTQKIGSGYNDASVELVTGTGPTQPAEVYPIISTNGIGYDARDDLNAHLAMFNIKSVGADEAGWPLGNDFRQIAIIKNPKKHNDSDFNDAAGNTLSFMKFTGQSGTFSTDTLIRGTTSDAAAYVDYNAGDKTYYHQNKNTGFKSFQVGETIQDSDDPGSNYGILLSDSDNVINPFSGEILYLENRAPILRDSAQTENIKIIINL